MGLALSRAALGPTVYDRILALNMFGTKTVLLIAVISFFSDRLDFLDLALVYALINFTGVIAVLKFSESRHFVDRVDRLETIDATDDPDAEPRR
jgi:multicomponent Na+:H+ antiporter subunit F